VLLELLAGGGAISYALSKLKDTIRDLLKDTETSFGNIGAVAAGQALLTIDNLAAALGDELNKSLQEASAEAQRLISAIDETLTELIKKISNEVEDIESHLNLDINDILNRVPLLKEKYLLTRIVGCGQLFRTDGTFAFRFEGNAFKHDTLTEVYVNGKKLERLSQSVDNQLSFSLPVSDFLGRFKDFELAFVPIKIICSRQKSLWKKLLSLNFNPEVIFSHDGSILLFPRYPFTYSLVRKVEQVTWVSSDPIGASAHCNSTSDSANPTTCFLIATAPPDRRFPIGGSIKFFLGGNQMPPDNWAVSCSISGGAAATPILPGEDRQVRRTGLCGIDSGPGVEFAMAVPTEKSVKAMVSSTVELHSVGVLDSAAADQTKLLEGIKYYQAGRYAANLGNDDGEVGFEFSLSMFNGQKVQVTEVSFHQANYPKITYLNHQFDVLVDFPT
jgi:hypothetical protein